MPGSFRTHPNAVFGAISMQFQDFGRWLLLSDRSSAELTDQSPRQG
jgi:hypothetical protein